MGGFYHSVLTGHQPFKGIRSNVHKNGEASTERILCVLHIHCLEFFALFQKLKSKNMFLKPHIFSALGKAVQGSRFSCQSLGGLDDLMI